MMHLETLQYFLAIKKPHSSLKKVAHRLVLDKYSSFCPNIASATSASLYWYRLKLSLWKLQLDVSCVQTVSKLKYLKNPKIPYFVGMFTTEKGSVRDTESPKALNLFGSPTNGHNWTRTSDPHDVNVEFNL
jgi:hypothetical protein